MITITEDRILDIEKRLNEIKSKNDETHSLLKEIKIAICGIPEMKILGIAQKVEDHERYINSNKKRNWTFAGAISAIVFFVTVFGVYLANIIFKK